MAGVISLTTKLLDVSTERPNEINPIHGESLLLWLAERARGRVAISEPEAEDWGWCSELVWEGRRYLLGASASDEEPDGSREWILHMTKHRSMKERLLGKGQMSREDECLKFFLRLLRDEPSFQRVSLE